MSLIRDQMNSLGLTLPEPASAKGSYTPFKLIGKRFASSGVLSIRGNKVMTASEAPDNLEWLTEAVHQATLNLIALIDDRIASAREIHIDHLRGFIAASAQFTEGHIALNAASNLLVEVIGKTAIHTREAVHVVSLPLGAAVEISVTGRWA